MSKYYVLLSSVGREWFDERAAIIEFDGGYSRLDAEQMAFTELLLMDRETRELMRK